jgi:hypothetical protein
LHSPFLHQIYKGEPILRQKIDALARNNALFRDIRMPVCVLRRSQALNGFFFSPSHPFEKDSDAGMAGKRAAFSGLPSRAELTELQA